LLVVLFIVMAITILSLGFVTRSDVELSCGQNMLLKTQMDYLAESGLEHARGLILNPQDVDDPVYTYWRGSTSLQLTSGSDYYDVVVVRDENDFCNYTIDCDAYRLDGTEKISLSRLRAELRLDPCIAYWIGSNTTISSSMIINGDVYCGNNLINNGTINGDVFAVGTIGGNGTAAGRQNESVTQSYPVAWPGLEVADFESIKDEDILTDMQGNYTGICYGPNDVNMMGNVTINGTLVVNGNLTVSGSNNVITAGKNLPALVVGGNVVMKNNSSLEINGLAQIEQQIMNDPNTMSAIINVTGGLFILNGGITSDVISVNITADPAIASIQISPEPGVLIRWTPAAGAFYRSIGRK